ncbi:MAG: tRNA guanosine(34) transglycosylase Tgt [Deltaproteobacteria bacterium]|nr:tRNA guanosine(34) transglycosylase Tgt [Deltaproteobacteria bacterium]
MLSFAVLATDKNSQARRGQIISRHGTIETPVFMPVGTAASVKSLDGLDLHALGAQIILSNTYHLMLRPGDELIKHLGGLHHFMGYNGAILTDSGGFQVFSLSARRKLSDHGVLFSSHIDGSMVELTPERAVSIQENLGSDIAMQLDECPPANASKEEVAIAVRRSIDWAKRCLSARSRDDVAWFGIVQGGLFEDLRSEHVAKLQELPFAGYAIGGVSVGEAPEDIGRVASYTANQLPTDKPRYLMGVGTPADLVRGVAAGIDMFDCVMPTRNARNGQLFTSTGKLLIKKAVNKDSDIPVDAACNCYTCRTFSRAYLRHLFAAKEITYYRLATLHNLSFYLGLMQKIRSEIENEQFSKTAWLERLENKIQE